jgi:hypothetical protein
MPFPKGQKHTEQTKKKLAEASLERSLAIFLRTQDARVGKFLRLTRTKLYRSIINKLGL